MSCARKRVDRAESPVSPVEAMETQLETSNGLTGSNDLARDFARTSNGMAKENFR